MKRFQAQHWATERSCVALDRSRGMQRSEHGELEALMGWGLVWIYANPVMCTPINPPLDVVNIRPISSLRVFPTCPRGQEGETSEAARWPILRW